MKNKTIKNLVLGAGITLAVSYITFKVIRNYQEKKLMKLLDNDEDYIEEEEEYVVTPRRYTKIKEFRIND